MKKELRISLDIHTSYFNQDFLDIEVKKHLAVYGDDLVMRLKPQFQKKAKTDYLNLFNRDLLYYCEGIHFNKVRLIIT